MIFEDLKNELVKEMLAITVNRIMYIEKAQRTDDILKEFFHLLDVGGFKIEKKDIPLPNQTECRHTNIGGSQGNECLDCGKILDDNDPVGF